ncbi:MAG: hypothetical protein KGL12_13770 [Rhodospirillales bacterium]|nr:hypothetical protein [Rhodospirillales bacterium]
MSQPAATRNDGPDRQALAASLAGLRAAPDDLAALLECAAQARLHGHRRAAASALERAALLYPADPRPALGLGDLALEEEGLSADAPMRAAAWYRTALARDSASAAAHRGLARLATEAGCGAAAARHAARGFPGHARIRCRSPAHPAAPAVLLLVAALGGNLPHEAWLDPRRFAITAIHPEYDDPAQPLPAHALIVNAIADADRGGPALLAAARLCARSAAAVINPPARVGATSRLRIARLAGSVPFCRAPSITPFAREAPPRGLRFPVLLRAPGFHSGRHFVRVERRAGLAAALAAMPAGKLLAIEILPSQGGDGRFRKYRVVAIGGRLWPVHLTIADRWKVHDFTAAMAEDSARGAAARAEEAAFLADMPAALGPRAMAALSALSARIGLDYLGIDFALAADGSVLLFEANPAMRLAAAGAEPALAYRQEPRRAALAAMTALLDRRMAARAA